MLTLDDGHDSTLLDSRGALETVSVNALNPKSVLHSQYCGGRRRSLLTSQELGLEAHLVEGVDGLVVVGLNLTCVPCRMLAISNLSKCLRRRPRSRSPVGRLQERLAQFVWSEVDARQSNSGGDGIAWQSPGR